MPVCIILVEPEVPDNIGAVSRAMKNMGLSDLRLVSPPAGWQEKGRKMAVNAADLLVRARVFSSLKEALADTCLSIATTRRMGGHRRGHLEFQEALERIRSVGASKTAALVFGKESKGLSNESLKLCDWFASIPSSPDYPSINLAQAVMIFAFSLYEGPAAKPVQRKIIPVSKSDFEVAMQQFREAVEYLEYKPAIVERIEATFRGMIKRAGLLKSEEQMIRGLSRRIRERTRPKYRNL